MLCQERNLEAEDSVSGYWTSKKSYRWVSGWGRISPVPFHHYAAQSRLLFSLINRSRTTFSSGCRRSFVPRGAHPRTTVFELFPRIRSPHYNSHMLRLAISIVLVTFLSTIASQSQTTPNTSLPQSLPEPVRYTYRISGQVSDKRGHPLAKWHVCWLPAERPLGGRVPCTRTAADGTYELHVQDIPDKYRLIVSDRDWLLVKKSKRNSGRTKTTDVLVFGSSDESRIVNFEFEP